jgi:molybdopterin/thiamine biosynthesis adenylyltransferase
MSQDKASYNYYDLFSRNLGLITQEQQEKLKNSKVCVFGAGGIGGTAFEILIRSGIGSFAIVDKDYFEASNINRQIFCFTDTIGKDKVEAAKDFGLRINPYADIETYKKIDEENIDKLISGADVILLAIDELEPCIIISRAARKQNIPIVEGWAIPFGNVRVFDSTTPELEEVYNLPTKGKPLSKFSKDQIDEFGREVLYSLGDIEGIIDYYSADVIERIESGKIPSFAPMVWLTSVFMAAEVLKILLNMGKIASGRDFCLYDPFLHKIPGKKIY